MSLSHELEARGFIHQFSTPTLQEILDGEKCTIYHGIDPTADSIHAGNFAVLMFLQHFIQHGHKVILLIGGGTGMIGDPKPDSERSLVDKEIINERVEKLSIQIKKLLKTTDVIFVNNNVWLEGLNLIDFLRDIGKHFTVNELIKKEAIANRLNNEFGISYTEFAYPLLQAYDFLQLNRRFGCNVQVGGSDQWGNMIAGLDLIRKKEVKTVHVITTPLIIDKVTGRKFGKSEGNAVWLDANKTSPYDFYQFWFNVSDDSVIEYLKIFTLLKLEDIEKIEREFEMNPGSRSAQKILAYEVTVIVHGEEAAKTSEHISRIIFSDLGLETLSETELKVLTDNAPLTTVDKNTPLVDVLVDSGLATSKREARTFIESKAILINGENITNIEKTIGDYKNFNGLLLLKRGKKQVQILKLKP